MGLEASKNEAHHQLTLALASLNEFGPAANGLRHLAKFVVERDA
jgi:geranylgeranyl pyrophosphate synthase